MEKELTVNDILNAKEIYLYDNDTLYVVDKNENAFGFFDGCKGWYYKANFWDYFDSEVMMSYLNKINKEEAVDLYKKWTDSKGK